MGAARERRSVPTYPLVTLATIYLKEKLTWQVMRGAALMASGNSLITATKSAAKKGEAPNKNGRPASGTTIYESKPVA